MFLDKLGEKVPIFLDVVDEDVLKVFQPPSEATRSIS
jgi:hypothetical protein